MRLMPEVYGVFGGCFVGVVLEAQIPKAAAEYAVEFTPPRCNIIGNRRRRESSVWGPGGLWGPSGMLVVGG